MASGGKDTRSSFVAQDSDPGYLKIAFGDLGKKETTNQSELEHRILQSLKIKVNVINTPWCAYQMCTWVEEDDKVSPKAGNARSFLRWGEEVNEPQRGDVVVFWRGSRNDGVTGHVGIYLGRSSTGIYVLGANQGDKVSIQEFSTKKLLGYRRYRSPWSTRTVKAAAAKVTVGLEETARHTVNRVNEVPVEAAEQSKTLLEQFIQFMPNMGQTIGIVITLIGAYIIYRRFFDHKERGQ